MPIENKKLITRAGLSKLGMRARNWYGLADSGTYKCVTAKEMCVEPFENPVPSDSIYDFNHEMGYSTDLSDEYSGNANKCLTFDPDFFTYNIKASVPIIFKITSNINACQASNILIYCMYKLNNSTTYTALKVVEKSKGSTIANGDTWVTTIDVPVVGGVLSTLDADSVDTSYLRIVVGTTSVSRTFKWRARRMIPGASPYIEDSGDVNLTTTTGTFLGINLHNYTNVSGLANYRDAAKEIYAVEIYVLN